MSHHYSLSRGEFPDYDEEKALGFEALSKPAKAASVSTGDDASCIVDVSDTETPGTSVRSSWQTFQSPDNLPLAPKAGSTWYRLLRWTVFSTYRRLFAFCFIANAAALIALGATHNLTSQHSATAAAINLLVSVLVRQEHVVNVLFVLSSAVPQSWPLWFRRRVAKIYCYGGWHSGCGIAAFLWYAIFVGYATRDYARGMMSLLPAVVLGYVLFAVLVLIIAFAYPTLRMRIHNYFEITHRFGGYAAVAIFWAQVVLLASATRGSYSIGQKVIHTPAFWCLVIITLCIIYPWLRLRKRLVRFQYLSAHAVRLHFNYTSLDYCVGIRLTTNPLFETHAFATIPNRPGEGRGYSVIISNAGDWTRSIIQSSKPLEEPPSSISDKDAAPIIDSRTLDVERYIYTKGAPIYGVLRVATIFRKPVIVTTGSGIGPCMSLLNGRPYHGSDWRCRVLWATKAPVKTYGQALVDDVRRADPRAKIVDTGVEGRPNMVELAWSLYKDRSDNRASWRSGRSTMIPESEAPEAVIVISNPKVTRKVVYGLESRGVPAYGVIFDS